MLAPSTRNGRKTKRKKHEWYSLHLLEYLFINFSFVYFYYRMLIQWQLLSFIRMQRRSLPQRVLAFSQSSVFWVSFLFSSIDFDCSRCNMFDSCCRALTMCPREGGGEGACCSTYKQIRSREIVLLKKKIHCFVLFFAIALGATVMCVCFCFGWDLITIFNFVLFTGNLITIVALLRHQKLRGHATTAFVLSLCISDLLFCSFSLPLTAIRYINKVNKLHTHLKNWKIGKKMTIRNSHKILINL